MSEHQEDPLHPGGGGRRAVRRPGVFFDPTSLSQEEGGKLSALDKHKHEHEHRGLGRPR